jgi:outer membrane lipoprotein carrier protein
MKFRFLFLALFFPLSAYATSIDALKSFVQQTQTARAQFRQIVLDKKMTSVQEASGTMEFARPGKFRWLYEKPYQQTIVGDGAKLWLYDPDLKQVTVKKLDQAIGGSPAALLAGNNEIEKYFNLKDIGKRGTLEWLEATPKGQDSSFELVRMGFSGEMLETMELRDHFGQTTIIKFSNLERNPKLAADAFRFTPPKGADVIGE